MGKQKGNFAYDILKGVTVWIITNIILQSLYNKFTSKSGFAINGYIAIIIALVLLILDMRFHKFRPFFPKLKSNHTVVERKMIFEIRSDGSLSHTKSHKIIMQRSSEKITDKFFWTGDQEYNYDVESQCDFTKGEERKVGTYVFYDLLPKTPLLKGVVKNFTTYFQLGNSSTKYNKFLSATISEPKTILILELRVPRSYSRFDGIFWTLAYDFPSEDYLDAGGISDFCITYEREYTSYLKDFKNPNLLFKYSIDWSNCNYI